MPTFIISYDSAVDENAHVRMRHAIAQIGVSWQGLPSFAVMHSDLHTVEEVRDLLRAHVGEGGRLLVVKSGVQAACAGFAPEDSKCLKALL